MEGYVYADPPPASEDAIKAWLRSALDLCPDLAAEAGRREAQADEKTKAMTACLPVSGLVPAFALGLIQRPIAPRSAAAASR